MIPHPVSSACLGCGIRNDNDVYGERKEGCAGKARTALLSLSSSKPFVISSEARNLFLKNYQDLAL